MRHTHIIVDEVWSECGGSFTTGKTRNIVALLTILYTAAVCHRKS